MSRWKSVRRVCSWLVLACSLALLGGGCRGPAEPGDDAPEDTGESGEGDVVERADTTDTSMPEDTPPMDGETGADASPTDVGDSTLDPGPRRDGDIGGSETGVTQALRADLRNYYRERFEGLEARICRLYWKCREHADASNFDRLVARAGRFDSLQECKQNLLDDDPRFFRGTNVVDRRVERAVTLITEGQVTFDAQRADDCLDAADTLENGPACQVLESLPACRNVLDPQSGKGDPCISAAACKEGRDCAFDTDSSTCYGHCEGAAAPPPASEGEGCPDDTSCEAGLTCEPDPDSSDPTCIAMRSREAGEPCSSSTACRPGLTCADGTCKSVDFGTSGDSCDFQTNRCEPPTHCRTILRDDGSTAKVCKEIATQSDSCQLARDCHSDLYCDQYAQDPVCKPVTAIGDPCTESVECPGKVTRCKKESGESQKHCHYENLAQFPNDCEVP